MFYPYTYASYTWVYTSPRRKVIFKTCQITAVQSRNVAHLSFWEEMDSIRETQPFFFLFRRKLCACSYWPLSSVIFLIWVLAVSACIELGKGVATPHQQRTCPDFPWGLFRGCCEESKKEAEKWSCPKVLVIISVPPRATCLPTTKLYFLQMNLFSRLCTPTHTGHTEIGLGALVWQPQPVWVPWCDSRNRASQYQIEAASWQRRADRMRAE